MNDWDSVTAAPADATAASPRDAVVLAVSAFPTHAFSKPVREQIILLAGSGSRATRMPG